MATLTSSDSLKLLSTHQEMIEKLNNNFSKLDNGKVTAETGKGLSSNDFTDTLKAKLDGIAEGANKTIVDSSMSSTSENPVQNKVVYQAIEYAKSDVNQEASAKFIPLSQKGTANGVASLDSTGKVPSSQLPSYVDDVLEYATQTSFPSTGEAGKIYVAQDTNKTYRWGGSVYTEISSSLALGETSSTAYAGNKGVELETKVSNVEGSVTSLSNRVSTLETKKLEKTKVTFTETVDTTSTAQPTNTWWKNPSGSESYYRYKYSAGDKRLVSNIYNANGTTVFVGATDADGEISMVSDGAFAGYFYIL